MSEEKPDQGRRGALLNIAALCGLTLSANALAALPKAAPKGAYQPILLKGEALKLTAVLAELIIPATDTPGALAVGAHRVIDTVLGLCSSAWDQARFTRGLALLDAAARKEHGKRFTALAPARQTALLRALEGGGTSFSAADRDFFTQLKSLTLFAYYTSEVGATRELRYAPVPGGYKGDVAFSSVGRRWAL